MTDFGIPTPLKAQCSLTGYEDSDDERGDESVQNSSFNRNVSELLDFVNRELMPNQLHNFEAYHENPLTEQQDELNDPLMDFDSNFEPVDSVSTNNTTLKILQQVQELGEIVEKNERRRERAKMVQKWRSRRRPLVLSAVAKLRIAQEMEERSNKFHAESPLGSRSGSDVLGAAEECKVPERCSSNPLRSCLKRHRDSYSLTNDGARKRVRIHSFK